MPTTAKYYHSKKVAVFLLRWIAKREYSARLVEKTFSVENKTSKNKHPTTEVPTTTTQDWLLGLYKNHVLTLPKKQGSKELLFYWIELFDNAEIEQWGAKKWLVYCSTDLLAYSFTDRLVYQSNFLKNKGHIPVKD